MVERIVDETEYLFAILYRMLDELSANPKLFDPRVPEFGTLLVKCS